MTQPKFYNETPQCPPSDNSSFFQNTSFVAVLTVAPLAGWHRHRKSQAVSVSNEKIIITESELQALVFFLCPLDN